jgi:hypothetical protein
MFLRKRESQRVKAVLVYLKIIMVVLKKIVDIDIRSFLVIIL